ncbi:MAG: homoserine O-succinyltransferase [Gammaproteobacteria bacterium]|nr:homoserine O-succinyltransferase [Gammaproteobacteria bacterium]
MPIVAHNQLPTFQRLRERGQDVLSAEKARHQDIRELHIGLLNMMPDAALAATEQQFIRLVGACNQIAQLYVYPFSIPELRRGPEAQEHIRQHYSDFSKLREQGLDALIITGANVANPSLDREPFWKPLMEIVAWANDNVASVLCSCLATHALVKFKHGIERTRLPKKQWGVYRHRVASGGHPLTSEINTRFDAPHSRYNDVSKQQLEQAGIRVLACSDEVGAHLAVSPDLFRIVYFQGHPEYDSVSLLKEYKREVLRFLNGERNEAPRFPENYFSDAAGNIATAYLQKASDARAGNTSLPAFPDEELEALVNNTWGDTGKAIVNNWLGMVYRVTNLDRRLQFMDGVDPDDPLGLR